DEDVQPLPGAYVLLLPDSLATTTDETGQFNFSGLTVGQRYRLQVRFLGFTPFEATVQAGDPALMVQLTTEQNLLETVLVTDEHAKQEETLSTLHFSEDFIQDHLQGTFSKTLEKLPGISAINVGVGIAKPVIRGLSANRIIVNQQGIKQESHQWGSDHGLEVDQFAVERVEIIKGPASLQYGSDGLGGVINIMPGRIPPTNTFRGSVQGVYKTNNDHWGGSAQLSANYQDFLLAAQYSRQSFGDFRVPADQFTYNSYTLPLYNRSLKNTAGQEQNIHLTTGYQGQHLISRVIYSDYQLEAGLFAGAVGIPRSYALEPDGNTRDIDIPKQQVNHRRISLHQGIHWEDGHLQLDLGYQRNLRQEYSYPEFHSIPSSQIDPGNTLALQFRLQTWSANLHFEQNTTADGKYVLGVNLQWQDNQRSGFEFLLPDFQTFRGGAFAIREWQANPVLRWHAGLRLDYGSNQTDYYRQWVWNSNETIVDSLIAPLTDQQFTNWSAAVGSSLRLADGQLILKGNLGKSFRVPYPAETVSNGIHHGTFRHEVGTPDLQSEHGYQLDVSADWSPGNFSSSLAVYANYFQNYIYLGPTYPARFSTLPEAGQIFQYRQDDALYTGFELSWQWQLHRNWRVEQSADYVQSYNLETQLALPFTPQPSVKTDLRYSLRDRGPVDEWFIDLSYEAYLGAEGPLRIDRSEQP
ncbi:MAG: TonB-dependent receptor, partial [Lewinella sp.]|nr:TonB-dependent receptor [Lewinella sp.]